MSDVSRRTSNALLIDTSDTVIAQRASGGELSVLALAALLLRRRYVIAGVALAAAIITTVTVVRTPLTYSSSATFIPQSSRPTSNFAGLASQFNINLDGGQAGQSPAFYVDLISSRAILGPIVDAQYPVMVTGRPRTASLVDILEIGPGRAQERQMSAIAMLRTMVGANIAPRTGIITVAATASTPALAYRLADRVLSELNRFNLENRQSQAGAERRFAEQRLAEVRTELRDAEYRLQEFLQSNRDYIRSPQLTILHDRISRDVDLRQQLQSTLLQSYERAKMEEVRDIPVITIIDRPDLPFEPNARGRIKKVALALLAGSIIGVILAFLLEYFSEARQREVDQAAELTALRRAALADLRRPWRVFRGQ